MSNRNPFASINNQLTTLADSQGLTPPDELFTPARYAAFEKMKLNELNSNNPYNLTNAFENLTSASTTPPDSTTAPTAPPASTVSASIAYFNSINHLIIIVLVFAVYFGLDYFNRGYLTISWVYAIISASIVILAWRMYLNNMLSPYVANIAIKF
jgi:hypothetical protein